MEKLNDILTEEEFDSIGIYTEYSEKPLEYNLRKAINFCKKNNLELKNFTVADWERFRITE